MHYLVAGILKPGTNDQLVALRDEWNEHLTQSNIKISLFGLLRGRGGERAGYIAFIEAENFDAAEAYMRQSPFYQNDLYERFEVAEFTPEVGSLG